jgi:hypothetical protein
MRPRLGHPFVDALEARAEDDEAGSRRPFSSAPLRKRLARTHDEARAWILRGGGRIEARCDAVGAHHHARAAASRRVVDRTMAAGPVLTDVARVQQL